MLRLKCLLFCALVLLYGCDRQDEPVTVSNQVGNRYVTLAPAMSQILIDMQQQSKIVGISQFDDTAAKDLPVVGNYLDIHTEKLLTLNPTHVLMMTGKAGTPPTLVKLANRFGFTLLAYPYPDTIMQLQAIVLQMGKALNLTDESEQTLKQMQQQLAGLKEQTQNLTPLRVLAVIGTDPIMASGPNTVMDDLIQWVGGVNVAHDSPVSAPVFDREKMIQLQPDVILLLSPGAALLTDGFTDSRLQEFQGLPIPAVENQRIVLINDPLTFLPATTLPRIATQIAHALYPQLAKKIADVQ